MVNLLRHMLFELNAQGSVRLCCAGKDHHPAGGFIQPVHEPGSSNLLLQQSDEIMGIFFPSIRQNRQTGRFVDDDDFSVSMQDYIVYGNSAHAVNCTSETGRTCLPMELPQLSSYLTWQGHHE